IPAVSVFDAGGLTRPLNIFGDQLAVLVLHGSLVDPGIRLEAADGVQLHAAPIEFQHQVSGSPPWTAEFLRAADAAALVVRQAEVAELLPNDGAEKAVPRDAQRDVFSGELLDGQRIDI